jgi:hypothetical protein
LTKSKLLSTIDKIYKSNLEREGKMIVPYKNKKLFIVFSFFLLILLPTSLVGEELGIFGDRHTHFEYDRSDQFLVRTRTDVLYVKVESGLRAPTPIPVHTPEGNPITDVVEIEMHISSPSMCFINTPNHVYAADTSEGTLSELKAGEVVTQNGTPINNALQIEHKGYQQGVLFIRTASNVYASDFLTGTETQFFAKEIVKPDGSSITGALAMVLEMDSNGLVVGIISSEDGVFASNPLNYNDTQLFTREIVKPSGESIAEAHLLTAAVDTNGIIVAVVANSEGAFGTIPTNYTDTQHFTREIVKPDGSSIEHPNLLRLGGVTIALVAAIANDDGVYGSDPLNYNDTQLFCREIVKPNEDSIQAATHLLLVSTYSPLLDIVMAANQEGVFGSNPLSYTETQLFTREIVQPSGDSIGGATLMQGVADSLGLIIGVVATPKGLFGTDPLNATDTELYTREIVTPSGDTIYGVQTLGVGHDGNGIVVAVVATPHTVYGSDPLNVTQTELYTREIVKEDSTLIIGVTHIGILPTPVAGAMVSHLRTPMGLYQTDPTNYTETQLFVHEIKINDSAVEGFQPGEIATPSLGSVVESNTPFPLIWGDVPIASDYILTGQINGLSIGEIPIEGDEFRIDNALASSIPEGLYELQVVAEDIRGFTRAVAPNYFFIGENGSTPIVISPPEIITPSQGAQLSTSDDVLSINWTDLPNVTEYKITAIKDGEIIVTSMSIGPYPQLTVPIETLSAGFYEIQIIAETADGFTLASDIRAFWIR